ncbi:MAG: hypothetical protein HQ515_26950 [Phycisphaeraceae bacterium]|nr:hypothetical protein [Phycisphaeraceae bacterium]
MAQKKKAKKTKTVKKKTSATETVKKRTTVEKPVKEEATAAETVKKAPKPEQNEISRQIVLTVASVGIVGGCVAAIAYSEFNPSVVATVLTAGVSILAALWKAQSDRVTRELFDQVREAEEQAFTRAPETVERQIEGVEGIQENIQAMTKELAKKFEDQFEGHQTGHLFNLYSKQIQQYQYQTQQRANSSFAFAIIAMSIGLVFVGLGAWHILKGEISATEIAAGSAVSVIGGALCAYITKAFLEVHKLSLNQLNRYFRQPVVNETILTAQRLADLLVGTKHKTKAYQEILQKVINHIGHEQSTIATDALKEAKIFQEKAEEGAP